MFHELSAWFRAHSSSPEAFSADGAAPAPAPPPSRAFASPADEGWQAVASLAEPDPTSELTAAGLPRRRPQAKLVPGGIAGPGREPAAAPMARGADEVRSRLSSLQRGVRAGRSRSPEGSSGDVAHDASAGPVTADPATPTTDDASDDLAPVDRGLTG